ncbi:MAG: hypothetical protein IPF82_15045 [Blastocatellia bacterium]|jgi:hypothetical protein|nr:hypothetical protein [Blastocatellia bacterium]
MTTHSDDTQFDIAVAEGTAFNAPSSERVPAGILSTENELESGLVDESDLQEQLSRMNSDFEDGLDVGREQEQLGRVDDLAGFSLGTLILQGVERLGGRVISGVRRNPVAVGIGLLGVGVGLAATIFAFARHTESNVMDQPAEVP